MGRQLGFSGWGVLLKQGSYRRSQGLWDVILSWPIGGLIVYSRGSHSVLVGLSFPSAKWAWILSKSHSDSGVHYYLIYRHGKHVQPLPEFEEADMGQESLLGPLFENTSVVSSIGTT